MAKMEHMAIIIGRWTDCIVCAAISTIGVTVANQFIVPKILEMRENKIKANKNPIGFRVEEPRL